MTDGESTPVPTSEPLPSTPDLELAQGRQPIAWQPLTPRGVGAFAGASASRIFLVELVFALTAAGVILWFLLTRWVPVVEAAIKQLPEEGFIEHQLLTTPRASPAPLAVSPFLGISIDLGRRSNAEAGSDLYLKFLREGVQCCSYFGCLEVPYPSWLAMDFNRQELVSGWGAWKPFVVTVTGVLIVLVLFTCWWLLACLYAPILWLLARARKRSVNLRGAHRSATAALMPGALLLLVAVALYGWGFLSLIQLCMCLLLHFAVAWIFLILIPPHLVTAPTKSSASASTGENPFGGEHPTKTPSPPENPFRR